MVLPSYNEGLPMAVLEAMSYGLPIVSTKVGDIPVAVKDGVNGYIVEPGDIVALKDSLQKMLSMNDKEWQKFSDNSRKITEDSFNDKDYYKKIAEAYTRE